MAAIVGLVGEADLVEHVVAPSSTSAGSAEAARRMSKPRARNAGSAIITFSSAVNSSNRVMIWNERATP